MTRIEVQTEDQQRILSKLEDLPPSELLAKCHTVWQRALWLCVREETRLLQQELKAYFSGEASNLSFLGEESKHTEKFRDYLLQLYDLIRVCWHWIEPCLKIVLREAGMKTNNMSIIPSDFFCLILESLIEARVYPCLGYFEVRPKKLDELARKEKKILSGEASPLAKRQYRNDVKAVMWGLDRYTAPVSLVEWICESAINNNLPTNNVISSRWRQYEQAKQALDKWNRAYCRKHKGQGYVWKDGQIIPSNRVGAYG